MKFNYEPQSDAKITMKRRSELHYELGEHIKNVLRRSPCKLLAILAGRRAARICRTMVVCHEIADLEAMSKLEDEQVFDMLTLYGADERFAAAADAVDRCCTERTVEIN